MQRTADLNIGRHGITPAVLVEIDKLLRRRELVKLKFGAKEAELRTRLLAEICGALGSEVAGTVGRTAAIYRYSDEAERHALDEPPSDDEPIG